ncbi:hypothetical protein HK102_008669, partial [Quaeritorhiza haematococci]
MSSPILIDDDDDHPISDSGINNISHVSSSTKKSSKFQFIPLESLPVTSSSPRSFNDNQYRNEPLKDRKSTRSSVNQGRGSDEGLFAFDYEDQDISMVGSSSQKRTSNTEHERERPKKRKILHDEYEDEGYLFEDDAPPKGKSSRDAKAGKGKSVVQDHYVGVGEEEEHEDTGLSGRGTIENELIAIDAQLDDIQSQIDSLYAKKGELEALRHSLLVSLSEQSASSSSNKGKGKESNGTTTTHVKVDYSASDFPWSDAMRNCAEVYWGISEFRHNQWEIMNAVMSRRDVFVIMPTGGGKSLCFQLPAILSKGITLVISPLISLITDQVFTLQEAGIRAEMLTGSTPKEDAKAILDELMAT